MVNAFGQGPQHSPLWFSRLAFEPYPPEWRSDTILHPPEQRSDVFELTDSGRSGEGEALLATLQLQGTFIYSSTRVERFIIKTKDCKL